jgi:hypothetical protein
MSSLHRDLIERRLWPIVALLVVAVVAVPFVLRTGASAGSTAVPVPPRVDPGSVPTVLASVPRPTVRALEASLPRDPFAGGMPKLQSKPQSQSPADTGATAGLSSSPTATTAATGSPAMVSPTPSQATGGTSSSGGGSPTVTTTTTVTTPAPAAPGTPAATGPWTIYSLDLSYGAGKFAAVDSAVPRLEPVPSAHQPTVMFMGVMSGGTTAVFMLGAGVQHAGQGVCRPSFDQCAAIVLRAGQTEELTPPDAAGTPMQLRVTSIGKTVTNSRSAAVAAYRHVSAAGQCELDLAHPVLYSGTNGTVSAVDPKACHGLRGVVPFPGTVNSR